jgi:hypothetical protein
MATSRRTGTNEQISTFGAAGFGRDYTSLSTWESATDNNLVSLAQSEVLECYDDAASFSDTVNFGGATTNSSYFRIIRPAGTIGTGSWQGHDGTPNTGVYFHNVSSNTSSFNLGGESYGSLQDLIIEMTNPSSSNTICIQGDGGNNLFVGIITVDITSANGAARGFRINNGIGVNCLAIRTDDWNFENSSGNSYFYNCTSVGAGNQGFSSDGGTLILKNCLSTNNTGEDFQTGVTYASTNNNASEDATAPGTSSRTGQTFSFVNAGNDDYHLTPTDAGARTYGADLSADGVFAFDDDIDGNIRS